MQLDLIRSFMMVLDERSLNRAALRLHMAQSTLTRQMRALEHEMGGLLLERSVSGVAPTAAGQALAARMRPLLEQFDKGVEEVRRLAKGQRGHLRVGYLLSAGQAFLNPALGTLRRLHPEVQVSLMDLTPGEQLDALRKGELDVALLGQEGDLVRKEFYTRKIATLPLYAVMHAGHPLVSKASVRLADLRGELWVGAPDKHLPGHNRRLQGLCRKAGFRPRIIQDSESLAQALSLVVSERAISLVPGYVKDLPAAGVVMKPLSDAHAKWDFYVAWQRGKVPEPVKVLVQAL